MSKASIISAALQIVFNTPQSSCYVGNPPNKPRKSRARKLLLFSSKYLDRTEKNPNIPVSLPVVYQIYSTTTFLLAQSLIIFQL